MEVLDLRRAVLATLIGALFMLGKTARADESEVAPPAEVAQARTELDAALVQMRAVSLRVRDDLRATRKRGTKMQITCVDQALSRADVATRRARETGDETLAAYSRGDLEGARAARRRLVEIRESQRVAARDGASCSAASVQASRVTPTSVKVDVDPRIAPVP